MNTTTTDETTTDQQTATPAQAQPRDDYWHLLPTSRFHVAIIDLVRRVYGEAAATRVLAALSE